jgi:dTDP-4-dehydrorhamnose 3,5-epimerase
MSAEAPELVRGGAAVDDRGSVAFINDLFLGDYTRFYIVANHSVGFVRAWHAHKQERKTVVVLSGAALVCAVPIDDWDSPSKDAPVSRFVLSERNPTALKIPAGYANGFMSLAPDTRVMFLSSSKLEESLNDDYRYESRLWDPWSVEER